MQNKKILLWLVLIVVSQIMFCGTASEEEEQMVNFQEGNTLNEITAILKTEGKPGFLYFTGST